MALLFEDFLKDIESYNDCERYWAQLVNGVEQSLGQVGEWQRWIPRVYGDGVTPLERDGNPMYDARSMRLDRAFRIIQNVPDDDEMNIAAWIAEYEADSLYRDTIFPSAELFIGLTLSDETAAVARDLLERWMTPETTVGKMRAYIRENQLVKNE